MAQLSLLIVLMFPVVACGGLSAPISSFVVSPDGGRVFVMVSPDAQNDRKPTVVLPDGRVLDVHQAFAKSGLYDVSTLAPVWQVDWFDLAGDVLIADDFRHVVRLNRFGLHYGWALAFYEDGRRVRTYDCGDLLTRMRGDWCLPFSTWDWHVRWYEDFELSADRRTVLVSTARRRTYPWGFWIDLGLQEFYGFDLRDGSIVSRRVEGAWRVWAYGAGVVLGLGGLVVGLRVLWRRVKRMDPRRGFPVVRPEGGAC